VHRPQHSLQAAASAHPQTGSDRTSPRLREAGRDKPNEITNHATTPPRGWSSKPYRMHCQFLFVKANSRCNLWGGGDRVGRFAVVDQVRALPRVRDVSSQSGGRLELPSAWFSAGAHSPRAHLFMTHSQVCLSLQLRASTRPATRRGSVSSANERRGGGSIYLAAEGALWVAT
jgi:hypothetical protein